MNPNINNHINDYMDNNNINKEPEENLSEDSYDDCFLCGIKQRENPKEKFYVCRECDRLLCQKCKKKHDLINPEHNSVKSYISGEINNNNEDDDKNPNVCINCQNKFMNNEENDDNNVNNNSNIKLRKAKINKNIQNMQTNQNKHNMPNYNLDNSNNNYNLDNSNKNNNSNNNKNNNNHHHYNLFQNQNENYPYDNENYNMKTQYQNDYGDKYDLYKNIMNNNNNNNNNDNINNIKNNKEYYNNIDEYENIEYDKEPNRKLDFNDNSNPNFNDKNYIYPTKKRVLTKRIDNNPNDNYNINNNLNNEPTNEDLSKKRKCKIEFDLNKDETEFDTCEIFGNPVCCNCLKSKKDEKNFKIFYCSQCMKLFCKDCLYQHNYISS